MLYFFYGRRSFVKPELKKIRDVLLTKRPDALLLSFDDSSAELDLEELALGRGLFETRYIVELDGLFSSGAFSGHEKEAVNRMQESENVFFVLEEELPKKPYETLRKNAEKTLEEKKQKKSQKEFSSFSLADALASRDKKRLWVLFNEAVERGYVLEEIHGILFWQMKMIVLAQKTNSAEEAGVKQFPYSKAKTASKNYSVEEAENVLHQLTSALVDAREKNLPLEHTLERVILSL
ncbi:MAG: hypothetical protein U5L75_02995 [Candidatus Campbellbacteria bacterium]|nr:hypothetical protein [Candidatus Campbellbacteria bacterium]